MQAFEAGTVLGDTYELISEIGRGGVGSVWAAQHLRLPRQCAVKLLHRIADSDSVAYARFRREAEIASRLNHANICEVLDFNVHADGVPYIVMPLLDGVSLSGRLLARPVGIDESRRWARQIGAALTAAHSRGVVHRDLKPANIFLCNTSVDGEPAQVLKVLDFGTSKILGSTSVQTAQATMLGTPQYMAPEQAEGANDRVGPHSDQFALAAVLFEALSGEPPFGRGHPAAIIYRIIHQPPASLAEACPDLDATVFAAIDRALSKDPAERFESVAAFVSAFCDGPMPATTGDDAISWDATMEAPASHEAKTEDGSPRPAASPRAEHPRTGWAVAGALGLGLAAAIAWPEAVPEPPQVRDTPRATSAPTPVTGPVYVTPPLPMPDEAPPPPPPRVVRAGETGAQRRSRLSLADAPNAVVDRPKKTQPRGNQPESVTDPQALADAHAAENALKAGSYRKALHLARRSQRIQRNGRAATVIAKTACAQNDLGAARAALYRIPRGRTAAVKRYCRRRGVEL